MVQQKDQRKKVYNTFRFDPYPNQRVGLKNETSKRKSNVTTNGNCPSNGHRLVSSTIGKGINRKRLSCDNLSEINRVNSLSVNNLNSLNQINSISTITLSTTNEITNKRGLSSLEPCCLCCIPRTKLTKNNSTTNLRHQRSSTNNRCNSNQKLDDSRKNLNSLKDQDDESSQLERYVPSQELYKRVVKEHLQLQSSFKILCQRLEEEKERSVTETKEKQSLKEQINNLMRKVDLLAMELQEARDQNELMEFRILESEQSKATFSETTNLIKCDKAIQLEPSTEAEKRSNLILPSIGNSVKMKTISPNGNAPNELFLYGLPGKRSAVSLDGLPGKSNKSCSSLESYGLTLSLTSEDEGLGDDGRRDQFSGPSSLSDIQMSDEESNASSGSSSSSSSSKFTDAAIQTSESSLTIITGPCQHCKESTNLEDKVNLLIEERDNLQEQVLELEEAENDARLVSQRLQRQVENLVNQVDCLQISLVKANQQIDQCNETIHTLRECELKLKVDFMMALIAKSEDSPSKLLDELKTKLKEKKNELASMGPMVFSSLNTFDDRSIDLSSTSTTINGSTNRHNFKQAIYQQQQQQQQQSSHGNSFNHQSYLPLSSFTGCGPDDCEIFVPEDSLPPNPGSSFHVQMLTSNRYNPCRPSQSTTTFSSPRSPLPLCETVKPKKIDLLLSPSPTYSSSSSPPLSSSSSPLVSPASSSSSSSSSSSTYLSNLPSSSNPSVNQSN
ncbi:putative leucine-rich repeat-containing protein DDB_G0290503 isoform X2 [Panonychus citri]|uniref:putative leucine-rich repeat-containing protein DDB_G0290503 isoform X2 n=1 Tax=Panonychus citri TaxID=50023 RepID=UPI002307B0B5|nr:putative leucine-rich repeat-containing protein DDB_G0290503 isoform X2 [Panonychus citri]